MSDETSDMKQIALDIGVSVGPSLANFYPGHNAAALAHIELWMAGSTRSPVPTYLWGESGSGKTHLLKAVAEHIRGQGALVGWMDASTQGWREPPGVAALTNQLNAACCCTAE